MIIYYNNEMIEIEGKISLLDLIKSRETIEHKAVWLNGEHIALECFNRIVSENDSVKVVRIRGGG